MIETALWYAAAGVPVFPCQPTGKRPLGTLVPHGLLEATRDESQIARWWRAEPKANIGLACGSFSRLLVLDVDGREGEDAITDLQRRYRALPDTLWQLTGSGGWHAFFLDPSGLGSTVRKLGSGLDTRGEGGYVIAPPSIHESGRAYTWHNPGASVAVLPDWLRRLLAPQRSTWSPRCPVVSVTEPYVRAAIDRETTLVATTPEGGRNHQLNASTFALARLIGSTLTEGALVDAMLDAARACGLSVRESESTIRSAIRARRGQGQRRAV